MDWCPGAFHKRPAVGSIPTPATLPSINMSPELNRRLKLTVLQGGRTSSIVVREVVGLDIRHLLLGEPLIQQSVLEQRRRRRTRAHLKVISPTPR